MLKVLKVTQQKLNKKLLPLQAITLLNCGYNVSILMTFFDDI